MTKENSSWLFRRKRRAIIWPYSNPWWQLVRVILLEFKTIAIFTVSQSTSSWDTPVNKQHCFWYLFFTFRKLWSSPLSRYQQYRSLSDVHIWTIVSISLLLLFVLHWCCRPEFFSIWTYPCVATCIRSYFYHWCTLYMNYMLCWRNFLFVIWAVIIHLYLLSVAYSL